MEIKTALIQRGMPLVLAFDFEDKENSPIEFGDFLRLLTQAINFARATHGTAQIIAHHHRMHGSQDVKETIEIVDKYIRDILGSLEVKGEHLTLAIHEVNNRHLMFTITSKQTG